MKNIVKDLKNVFFIGIGGTGMSALAFFLLEDGKIISGSDKKESRSLLKLKQKGVNIYIGHNPDNISKDVDVVVYSGAIPSDNCELLSAKQRNIPVLSRAQMLSKIIEQKFSIAVAGTHGKTTTTSMIGKMLNDGGLDPSFLIGGELNDYGANARHGSGPYIVIEADESDGSFLNYKPNIAVITNIDFDHPSFFSDLKMVEDYFEKFMQGVNKDGKLVICGDHAITRSVAEKITDKEKIFYGFGDNNQVQCKNLILSGFGSYYDLYIEGKKIGEITLNVPGIHNVLNSLAAFSVAKIIGLDFVSAFDSIASFSGVRRRFELKCKDPYIIDDYAHHPEEINVVLNTARSIFKDKNLVLIFQPHRFTRTEKFLDNFCDVLAKADTLLLVDIFPAGEKVTNPYLGNELFKRCKKKMKDNIFFASKDSVCEIIQEIHNEKNVYLFMGAGDITKICDKVASIFLDIKKDERKEISDPNTSELST
ncbi:UDP-N-acetylmuramate--L-alanine ligase [Thermodesulfobium acidiphilum]|uniref:UDP-N-acetylmuramate--L-alanine ligase n=1 Tax=Thermodesulfobium acidiphilum TaxID=1794699 RepID=A0A2R4VZU4_THEAF|nr:UDP-N-acetylmuramate--L-alanine ligase [Thermodesulfobium acidiphilum]AWB10006.1 UDP-N-acetylmuramate--L-alanine ligase [Thermodesulfobium acidiphilum]